MTGRGGTVLPPQGPEDLVADLVRLGGRRSSPPPEVASRVKAAARAAWDAEVAREAARRRRTRRFTLAAAATLLIVAGVSIWLRVGIAPAPVPAAGDVVSLVRTAWHHPPDGAAFRLEVGQPVPAGHVVATGEEDRVAVRLAGGQVVRLDGGTRLEVASASVLVLEQGAIYVDTGGLYERTDEPIEIRTPRGTVRDIGTQFEVRLRDDLVLVRVREGLALLEDGETSYEIPEWEQLEIGPDGTVQRGDARPNGPEWTWIESVTPMLDIDGRSASEFLEWMARERGLALRYSGEAVAESASRTVLSGSVEGLTLDEALAVVLPTCRLVHRIETDALVIEPLPGAGG